MWTRDRKETGQNLILSVNMKQEEFKQLLDRPLDIIRLRAFDPSLTPKQRTKIRAVIRRRERLGNSIKENRHRNQRVEASIYMARDPRNLRKTTGRYKNSMKPSERMNAEEKMLNLRKRSEENELARYFRSGTPSYKKLLQELKNIRLDVQSIKRHLKK
jgi:hypothetical protein